MYFLVALIFLLAGFTQGVSGFGSALVAMPLLTLFIDVKTAVPLCMLNGLLITSFLSWQLRRHIDWRKIRPLFFGCLPGIYMGVTFLKRTNDSVIKVMLGVMLIAYVIYRLSCCPRPRKIHAAWSYLAGFATGAIGGAFSAGGPPTIIYTTLTGWSKDEIKATLSGFFLVTGLVIAAAHASSGLTTVAVLRLFGASSAAVLVGVCAGSVCYGRFKTKAYLKIIFALLAVMGVIMIGSAF